MSTFLIGTALVALLLVIVARSRRDERISMPTGARTADAPRSVEALMLAGRKIEAIKLLREETGLGLKEAKEEVEARQRKLQGR